MKTAIIRATLALGTLCTFATALPRPAAADTTSTLLIAGAAAAIVGSLIYDSNRKQYYYARGNNRTYVSNSTAMYYRGHGGRYRGPDGHTHGNAFHDNRPHR